MKLYTEQQLKDALNIARFYHEQIMPNDTIVKKLTPIELPSDEEIEEIGHKHQLGGYQWQNEKRKSFTEGAKWMRDKILNK